jgi:hypothetical protein
LGVVTLTSGVVYECISIADGVSPCGRDLDFSLACELSADTNN